jgi:hypothetical protein
MTSTTRRWLGRRRDQTLAVPVRIFISDPKFADKAAKVLDLYNRVWDGKPLSANDFVISADEKTSIQARCRCHPCLPQGKVRMMRISQDCHRAGALAHLAAYGRPPGQGPRPVPSHDRHRSVHRAGRTGRDPGAVRLRRPRVLVVDNGSSHRGVKAIDRLAEQLPKAVLMHTRLHPSWLNQVEVHFLINQRKHCPPTTSPTSTSCGDTIASTIHHARRRSAALFSSQLVAVCRSSPRSAQRPLIDARSGTSTPA